MCGRSRRCRTAGWSYRAEDDSSTIRGPTVAASPLTDTHNITGFDAVADWAHAKQAGAIVRSRAAELPARSIVHRWSESKECGASRQ
ncbi:BQ5605_C001g00748 [Microbotryum silenes-dioicae]|uniref:BQ5605_C001g00748 protein n=1 Tax=Microbotryum silenes-dioicae TaxID=796604 RepID=A0A2X0M8B5_9BASI|nr:BQ5605_C001g00748 [Microbotryum silenes-dioicae]